MATHLTLLCHGATRAMREGAFGTPEDALDDGGRAALARFRLEGPAPTQLLTSPALAARQTADHFAPAAIINPVLSDMHAGAWSGRALADLLASEPQAATAWLADPTGGTPDGETMAAVADRLRPWLATQAASGERILAVSHPMVLRAVLALVLDASLAGVMAVDVAPLAMLTLSFNGRWRLQGLRAP